MKSVLANCQADALASFRNYKKLAERAIEQVDDEQFFAKITYSESVPPLMLF